MSDVLNNGRYGWDSVWRITATFQPRRTHDLRPEAAALVGQRLNLTYAWTAEDDERFAGQACWIPDGVPRGGLWIPTEDLADIEAHVAPPTNSQVVAPEAPGAPAGTEDDGA